MTLDSPGTNESATLRQLMWEQLARRTLMRRIYFWIQTPRQLELLPGVKITITPSQWRTPRLAPWLTASLALHVLLALLFLYFEGGQGGDQSLSNTVTLSPGLTDTSKPHQPTGFKKSRQGPSSDKFNLAQAGMSLPSQWIRDALNSEESLQHQNDEVAGLYAQPSFPGGTKSEFGMVSAGDPRFLSFYSRLTDKVRFHWMRELDQVRYLLGNPTHQKNQIFTTEVTFEFASDGSIVGVELAKNSAMAELDRAALQAILKSKYLPNVPKDLLAAKDGNQRITFSFNVQFL